VSRARQGADAVGASAGSTDGWTKGARSGWGSRARNGAVNRPVNGTTGGAARRHPDGTSRPWVAVDPLRARIAALLHRPHPVIWDATVGAGRPRTAGRADVTESAQPPIDRRRPVTAGGAVDRRRDRQRDLTEAAAAAFEIRDLTLGCFAHDVRSPLSVARTALGMLLVGEPREEGDRELLASSVQALERVEALLEEVLQLDRVRGEAAARDSELVDLAELAAAAAGACSAPDRIHTLLLSATSVGVPSLLQRALVNLLDNALSYGATRAEIAVGPSAGGALVLVDDDGAGIPAADRDFVFQPFVRLSQDSGRGLGLGLALVRRIVMLHGGMIWVEDGPLGGARFGLWLPGPPDQDRRAGER
jgi:signal transduction histidine kinase